MEKKLAIAAASPNQIYALDYPTSTQTATLITVGYVIIVDWRLLLSSRGHGYQQKIEMSFNPYLVRTQQQALSLFNLDLSIQWEMGLRRDFFSDFPSRVEP